MYSTTTSTSGLRKHLLNLHLEEWVESCDSLGLEIKAKQAALAANLLRAKKGQYVPPEQPSDQHPEFSNETFVDALTDFVISDDQVSIQFHNILAVHLLYLFTRASMSSRTPIFDRFFSCYARA